MGAPPMEAPITAARTVGPQSAPHDSVRGAGRGTALGGARCRRARLSGRRADREQVIRVGHARRCERTGASRTVENWRSNHQGGRHALVECRALAARCGGVPPCRWLHRGSAHGPRVATAAAPMPKVALRGHEAPPHVHRARRDARRATKSAGHPRGSPARRNRGARRGRDPSPAGRLSGSGVGPGCRSGRITVVVGPHPRISHHDERIPRAARRARGSRGRR